MLKDATLIGDWCRVTKLGAGRFGDVWLWNNSKSSEKIAVKLCHAAVESVTPFIKMRWIKEIEYLNQTRCDELVGGINVQPETFLAELNGSNANGMPALIMEYCDGGNLRQLFNQHRNVCGMVESDVKQILFALKNAIFHLHSHSFPIVHHNICPENVIIKLDRNNRRIYKLCNLGKTISTDVRCAEVSGITAFDYIAPELIISENNHNIAADYWSVGVIVYEAATGYRPFAPHLPSGQWMLRVRDKKSEHITIYEKDNGEFVYSDRIMAENKMSTIFAEMLERWLRPALEWHPKQRGFVSVEREDQSTPPLQSMKFYELIHVMRKTKVLTLFVLTNQRSLSMAIDRNTTYDNLFEFIEREAQIPKSKCNLIRASDTKHDCIDTSKGKPIDLYVYDHNICDDNPMVYVNQIGGIGAASTTNLSSLNNGTDDTSIAPDIPDSVRNVLLNHEQRLKVHSLSKFATDTLYFVQSETRNYHNSLRGWHNYAQQISQAIDARRQDVKQLQSNAYGLKGALDLYAQTVDVAQTACDINDDTIGKCAEQSTKIAANIELLMEACDRIINRYESMDRRSRNACKNEVLHKYRNSNDIYDMTNVSKAYDLLRAQVDNKKFVDKPHFELFQCAYKCLKRRDALLRNKEFVEVQRSLNYIQIECIELKKALAKAVGPVNRLQNELIVVNRRIIEHIHSVGYTKIGEKLLNSASTSTTDLLDVSNDACNTSSHSTEANGRCDEIKSDVVQKSSIRDTLANSSSCFGAGDDIKSLIEDHESLRVSIIGLMKEIDEEFAGIANGHNQPTPISGANSIETSNE